MEIVKISSKNFSSVIIRAVKILKQGGVIVYPTDTAYALGGFFDSRAVTKKILQIKGRTDKKFTVIAAHAPQAQKYFKLSKKEIAVAKKFWPGPLSIVVSPRFAVRVPDSHIAQVLAKRANRPLIATSANISGTQTLYSARAVYKQFANKKNRPEFIIDVGRLPKKPTSTLVTIGAKKITILRPGPITINSSLTS